MFFVLTEWSSQKFDELCNSVESHFDMQNWTFLVEMLMLHVSQLGLPVSKQIQNENFQGYERSQSFAQL